MKNAVGVSMIGAGALLIYAAFKGKSVWKEILDTIRA